MQIDRHTNPLLHAINTHQCADSHGHITSHAHKHLVTQNFTVDINAPLLALLPQLAFEGATRRNRPNLKYVSAPQSKISQAKGYRA